MTVQEYQPSYFDYLVNMHELQGASIEYLIPETLPKIGFVACDGAEVVCIGFLRLVEGGYAQIDTLVTNPVSSSSTRNEAISLVVDRLLGISKQLKLLGILIFSTDKSILTRAEATGFKHLHHSLMALDGSIWLK